jgi:hypothetical protein
MPNKLRLLDIFEGKGNLKLVLGTCVIVFFAIELLIFIAASASSGDRSFVEVKNKTGQVVYRTSGNTVGHIQRDYFERHHGSLENYDIEVTTLHKPFPVREWVVASIGIPVGLILLVSFLIKVYLSLIYGEETAAEANSTLFDGRKQSLLSWSQLMSSVSVYTVGALILFLVLLLWLVPNFFWNLVSFSMTGVQEHRGIFLGLLIGLALFISWIAFLRYKLSKKMMENQLSLEKYRIDKQFQLEQQIHEQLPPQQDKKQLES